MGCLKLFSSVQMPDLFGEVPALYQAFFFFLITCMYLSIKTARICVLGNAGVGSSALPQAPLCAWSCAAQQLNLEREGTKAAMTAPGAVRTHFDFTEKNATAL